MQFGGQTPLNLALPLKRLGVPIIGTDPEDIDLAEDRKLFGKLLDDLKIPCPDNGTATSVEEACAVAARIGYPVLVRPSYVLGGRAMVIAYDEEMVRQYMREAVTFSQDRPVLVDRFLEDATEVDVDALGDGNDVLIAGIMEHIEEAGVHSGDSSCVLPPQSLSEETLRTIEDYTVRLAKALRVIGLMNVQYAIQNGVVYVLEVNPRASRTVPYVSKATGVPLPKIAVGLMWGRKLKDYGFGSGKLSVPQVFVKSPVFPFNKFHGVDPVLGPEMRSTGEVMGVGINFGEAFLKAQISRGQSAARKGHGLHQRQRSPQGGSRRGGETLRRTRLLADRHARHGSRAAQCRTGLQDGPEGERRPAQRGRSAEGRQHPARDLHHHRRVRLLRRKVHPPQRRNVSRAVHHDDERRARRRRRCRRPPARPDPRLEPAGNSRTKKPGGCFTAGPRRFNLTLY